MLFLEILFYAVLLYVFAVHPEMFLVMALLLAGSIMF
jgi:hypothetical protein